MKILLTGSEGYIGSYLVDFLRERNYLVLPYDLAFHHDILDLKTLRDHIKVVDVVIHLAALVGDPKCAADPELAIKTNQEGTGIVVRTARELGIEKLIYASTCSIYGTNHREMCTTESDPNPLSIYAWTKFIGERIVLQNGYQALRFGTAYGITPNTRYNLIINGMYRNAKEGKNLWMMDKDNYRPFAHVRTICKKIEEALYNDIPLRNVVDFNATIETVAQFFGRIFRETFGVTTIIDKGETNDRRSYKVAN